MTKNELKKLVKECVKECMAEMFMEMKLENIIEAAMNKVEPVRQQLNETRVQQQQLPIPQPEKVDLKKKLGVSDNDWKSIYAGVSAAAPLPQQSAFTTPEQPKPPEVDANKLAKIGVYRDYSKFI